MKLVIASRSKGKLSEYQHLLEGLGFEVISMEAAGIDPDFNPPEEGDSFEANARSKALGLQRLVGGFALGDDSGLEVDALDGRPGIHSARYAGIQGRGRERDRANTEKLLQALSRVPEGARGARFVCVIVLRGPEGQEIVARGSCEGKILSEPRGSGGFGYDPVFLPEGFDRTMAELAMQEKNRISHRGKAFESLLDQLQAQQEFGLPTRAHRKK